jgi:hypothetical protein
MIAKEKILYVCLKYKFYLGGVYECQISAEPKLAHPVYLTVLVPTIRYVIIIRCRRRHHRLSLERLLFRYFSVKSSMQFMSILMYTDSTFIKVEVDSGLIYSYALFMLFQTGTSRKSTYLGKSSVNSAIKMYCC